MNCIVKVFFIAVLVLAYAAGTEGDCSDCTEDEFCHNIFWFFSRCIRYRVEGDRCDYNHRICGPDLKCRRGTCQSSLGRSKSLTTTTSSTVEMSRSTTTKIVTVQSNSVSTTETPSKADILTGISKFVSESLTTTSVAFNGTSTIAVFFTDDFSEGNLI